MNEENEKKPDLVEEEKNQEPPKKDTEKLRKRLMLIMGVIVAILLLIVIILLLIKFVFNRTLSFEKIENKMKNAAIEYYKVQKDLLPQEEGGKDLVDASTLSASDYMKPLNEYVGKGVSCTGEVSVEKINGRYVYTPYLDCGDKYQTKELYRAVIEQGLVTSGYGLYQFGSEYVYRGETVNNYVTFANTIWRIVKVTANNQVLLILDDEEYMPDLEWDDRYNQQEGTKTGINAYHVSRVKEALELYYKEKTDDTVTFSSADQDKLASFSLCVGAREENYAINDNAKECALVEENQMIGLLTVSDYLNASADSNCHSILDRSCQNYNYLRMKKNFWLVTPNSKDTKSVYYVASSGYVSTSEALSSRLIRPTVLMNRTVMIASGSGTKEKPFTLK